MSNAMLHGCDGGSANLITKSITANGTYNASSDNADGYSEVSVNVISDDINKMLKRTITSLPSNAFDGVTTIPAYIFGYCGNLAINNLILPNTVTRIETYAFRSCFNITGRVLVPDSVTSIEQYAFAGDYNVEEFIIGAGLSNYSYNMTFNPMLNYNTVVSCKRVIIRRTTSVPSLNNETIFAGSNASAHSSQKYPIFVYNNLISQYVTATNWTIYASQNRILPWVSTTSDLSQIDTSLYTKACVIGADESYKEYTYDGNQWNEVV